MAKLLSVIIPTYNRKALTDAAIASVVTEHPALVEIVVVDDYGSDVFDFQGFNSSDVSVRVLRLDANVGAGMARQAGVNHSVGKYIAFLDSDDCYDAGWIDNVLNLLQTEPVILKRRALISGRTEGGRSVAAMTRKMLESLPQSLRIVALRLVTIVFNPFYTPSLVISKEICSFKEGLRHCEDYYSTALAVFMANDLVLAPVLACHLGRAPNSTGGESAAQVKMFKGELQVRFGMLTELYVPFTYKLLVPVGIAYQYCRTVVKYTIHFMVVHILSSRQR